MTLRAALALTIAARIGAQEPARALSLSDAVGTALGQSETMTIARAGLTRARGQVLQARAPFLPQLFGTL
ncbi:MAG TPA: hypothetical protein VK679_07735, partial [Gemmatimonadaceae bacterium]|nr:hypothetical protein [Gemmatimonadaceae bacterium]